MDELRQILARELSPAVEILRLLDRGRTSSVWLARESALKRFVAVKVLAAELVQDEVARRRFEREATAAAALRHPDVVPVYRFGYLPQGLPYLVMQYVSGRTLEDRLAAEGPLPLHGARRTLAVVADELAAAHRHGFIRRDLRPANVRYDPETGRALVTDFGLAGVLPSGEPSGTRLTRRGKVPSSAEYTSPSSFVARGRRSKRAAQGHYPAPADLSWDDVRVYFGEFHPGKVRQVTDPPVAGAERPRAYHCMPLDVSRGAELCARD